MIDRGPWLLTINGKSAICFADETYDGGMVEFWDAVTGLFRGCAGIHWWHHPGHAVRYEGTMPIEPEEGRWL